MPTRLWCVSFSVGSSFALPDIRHLSARAVFPPFLITFLTLFVFFCSLLRPPLYTPIKKATEPASASPSANPDYCCCRPISWAVSFKQIFLPKVIMFPGATRPSPRAFKCYMARKLSMQNSGGYMMRSATLEAKYYKSGYQYCSQGSCTLSQAPKRWKTMFVVLIDNIIFSVYQCEPNFFEPTSFKAREIHCKTRTGKPRYVVVYEVVVYLPWPLASFNNHIDVQSNCHSLIYVQMAASV